MAEKYISVEAASAYAPLPKHLREYQTSNLDDAWEDGYDFAIGQIQALPAADVVERKRGEWKKEMPKDDGWYWVMTDFFNGHTEILPCYYKAKYNELQTIDDGIACEVYGVAAIMPMKFPEPPKEG